MSRNNSLDLLRIICCFAVVLLHVNVFYFINIFSSPNFDKIYIVENFINIVTRFCVPCFVLISGAFNLNNNKNMDFKYFYKKSFIKIFLPMLFLYFILSLFFLIEHNYSISLLIRSFFYTSFYNNWYMYMLFFLYMITPFILIIKNNVSEKVYFWISIVLVIWSFVSQLTSNYMNALSSGITFSYLGYYMIGNVIYNNSLKKSNKKVFISVLISILMVVITFLYRQFISSDSRYVIDAYTNFFSPTIIIFSISIFYFFCNIKIKFDLTKLSSYTFYIYIFHTIIYYSIFNYCQFLLTKNQFINIFVVTNLTFLISLFLSVIFKWFWNKYIVVKKS